MFKSLIVTAALAAGPIAWAASPMLPASPLQSTPPAVSAPATASSLPTVVTVAPVSTCGTPKPSQAPTAAAEAAPGAQPSTGGVNLNTATADQLEALPGIGKATAARIVAARPIASVDAVDGLPGVNAENFAKFRGLVTV